MSHEITGRFRRDEGEASRLCGAPEAEAAARMDKVRPPRPSPRPGKPDPFGDVETPARRRKPDPFSDVESPEKGPDKPNPF